MSYDVKKGYLLGIFSYVLWGLSPVYFKMLGETHPIEVVAHRVIWGMFGLLAIIFIWNRTKCLFDMIIKPRIVLLLGVSSVIIGINWSVYIWAVMNDQMIEAALGYYLNPLINVLFGIIFFRERFNYLEKFGLVLAIIAVSIQIYWTGTLPWVSIALAFNFALYGLMKRYIKASSLPALFIETLWMTPIALLMLFFVFMSPEILEMSSNIQNQTVNFIDGRASLIMLMMCGLMVIPLLTFSEAAKYLSFSSLGFLQYIAPTATFLLAIFIYGETMENIQWISFSIIWVGLTVFLSGQIKWNNLRFFTKSVNT